MEKRNSNGTIKKGVVLNPKGRPKGALNRNTAELKEALKTILDAELEKVQEYLELLEPKERLDFVAKLLPYVVPKQSEVDHKNGGGIASIPVVQWNFIDAKKKKD